MSDTIIALASAAGRSGVAVVRISGPDALACLFALSGLEHPPPRKAVVRNLCHPNDDQHTDLLDQALVISMPGPTSFTGEDILELHLHGGPAIIDAVIGACLDTKLVRLAEAGEFTRRAFENDRLDLTRAEAVADLIDAETEGQRRQAFRQYQGELEDRFENWRHQLIAAMASQEAAIDFPDEDDVPVGVETQAFKIVCDLTARMSEALSSARAGRAVRDGYNVAIIGAPNAGKSSLLNALADRDAAIVSDIPGTTRDVLELRLVLNGYVVWLLDTAGLRETSDAIEAEGVRRAMHRAETADLRILVAPSTDDPPKMDLLQAGDLLVISKTDLSGGLSDLSNVGIDHGIEVIPTSTVSPGGVDELKRVLSEKVAADLSSAASAVITRRRHQEHLVDALEQLDRARQHLEGGFGAELVSEDLRLASRALGQITGRVDVEDLLDKIFSDFCIGK